MEEKKDLRLLRTDRAIKQAMKELMEEKAFEKITVQDILERALVNRTNFYRHFPSKYTLAAAIAQDFMAEFISTIDDNLLHRTGVPQAIARADRMCEHFYAERKTLLALWKIQIPELHLYEDMQEALKRNFQVFLAQQKTAEANVDFQSTLFAAMILTVLKYMLENEPRRSAQELAGEVLAYFQTVTR